MKLGSYTVEAWLERGPAHQLFRTDGGLLLYSFLPTSDDEARERVLPRARELVDALGTGGAGLTVAGSELSPERVLLAVEDLRVRSVAGLELPLEPTRALLLARELLATLTPLHAGGLYHGALTPSRLGVDEGGRLRVFGAGCALLAREASAKPLTTLTPFLSDLYPEVSLVPPEVFHQRPLDPATDVFLVAAHVYLWMAGHPAHGSGRALDVYGRLRAGERERFAALEGDVGPDTLRALDAALEPSPADRPAGDELAERLASYASDDREPLPGQPGPYELWSAALPDQEPGEAPGPPGSEADQRRETALKVAAAQLGVMRAHRPEPKKRSTVGSMVMIIVMVAAALLFFFYFRPQMSGDPVVRQPGPIRHRANPPPAALRDAARALPDAGAQGQSGTD